VPGPPAQPCNKLNGICFWRARRYCALRG
jgi:hypothetical protein